MRIEASYAVYHSRTNAPLVRVTQTKVQEHHWLRSAERRRLLRHVRLPDRRRHEENGNVESSGNLA